MTYAEQVQDTRGQKYLDDAQRTKPDRIHAAKVNFAQLIVVLQRAVNASNALDDTKKALFYGKDTSIPNMSQDNAMTYDTALANISPDFNVSIDVIHGIVGLYTEAGELVEALLKCIEKGKPLDLVNIKEEIGDCFWYQAVLARAAGFTFEQAQDTNIAKLRKRFPNKFTEHDANNRDLAAERKVLERDDMQHAGEDDIA